MPKVPSPVTSPPNVPGQPYDATDEGANSEKQSAPTTIYDSAGGPNSSDPWIKIQDGGHANPDGTIANGQWPDNGTSSGGGWKQV